MIQRLFKKFHKIFTKNCFQLFSSTTDHNNLEKKWPRIKDFPVFNGSKPTVYYTEKDLKDDSFFRAMMRKGKPINKERTKFLFKNEDKKESEKREFGLLKKPSSLIPSLLNPYFDRRKQVKSPFLLSLVYKWLH